MLTAKIMESLCCMEYVHIVLQENGGMGKIASVQLDKLKLMVNVKKHANRTNLSTTKDIVIFAR